MTIERRMFVFGTVAAITGLSIGGWALAPARAADIKVFKSPSCGCCNGWIDHLRKNGFSVEVVEQEDVSPIKARLGVPHFLESCHTASFGNYVIEGHVPAADIRRLLELKPEARGLAVPGMPVGSPGMEYENQRERFEVVLFGDRHNLVFARY